MNNNNPAQPGVPPTPSPAKVRTAEQARRILVVDDDPDMRHLLFHLLRAEGYRVVCAKDGEAGWDALCASGFDAMITDYDMPRLNGLGLLRRVRAGPVRLPVIVISGDMPWQDRDLVRLLPPGLAIAKPFNLAKFLEGVRATFGSPRKAEERPGHGNDGGLPSRPRQPPRVVLPIA